MRGTEGGGEGRERTGQVEQGLGGNPGEVGAREGCGQRAGPDPGAHRRPLVAAARRTDGGEARAGAADQKGGDCIGSDQVEAEKRGVN